MNRRENKWPSFFLIFTINRKERQVFPSLLSFFPFLSFSTYAAADGAFETIAAAAFAAAMAAAVAAAVGSSMAVRFES